MVDRSDSQVRDHPWSRTYTQTEYLALLQTHQDHIRMRTLLEKQAERLSHHEKQRVGIYHGYHRCERVSRVWLDRWAEHFPALSELIGFARSLLAYPLADGRLVAAPEGRLLVPTVGRLLLPADGRLPPLAEGRLLPAPLGRLAPLGCGRGCGFGCGRGFACGRGVGCDVGFLG